MQMALAFPKLFRGIVRGNKKSLLQLLDCQREVSAHQSRLVYLTVTIASQTPLSHVHGYTVEFALRLALPLCVFFAKILVFIFFARVFSI